MGPRSDWLLLKVWRNRRRGRLVDILEFFWDGKSPKKPFFIRFRHYPEIQDFFSGFKIINFNYDRQLLKLSTAFEILK